MQKIIHITEGEQVFEFFVKTNLTLVVTAVHLNNAKVTITIRLVKKGATASITGIIIAGRAEKISFHTIQIHAAPDTTSDLLVKTILSDHAKCLYDGGIRVETQAQKTNAYQRNDNLMLSGHAYVQSKPSLEILADDVRCTHGATSGPIDPDELWYLSTRGIGPEMGEKLITEGFIKSALMRIGDQRIIDKLWQTLFPY